MFRKSQPFWNSDLENLWKTTCQSEKNLVQFKVMSKTDIATKAELRNNFKCSQKNFDKKCREAERTFKKQKNETLGNDAKFNPTGMWSSLKKLNNPPTSKAALEIVREDDTISHNLKEILQRWLVDISKLFSGVRDKPEMAFDDTFFDEIVGKKREFEQLFAGHPQPEDDTVPGPLNNDLSFSEVSKAIDNTKLKKAYLEIPNEAMKNFDAKCVLHKFFNLCFKSGLSPIEWDFSDIKPVPKKDKDHRDPLQNRCITIMCCVAKVYSKILTARLQKYLEDNNI